MEQKVQRCDTLSKNPYGFLDKVSHPLCFLDEVESMTTHRQTTGQHDDSPTVFFHRQPTHALTDTTSHRHNFKFFLKNHWLTRPHSPTVTIPGKWMKENLSVNHKVSLFIKAHKKIPSVWTMVVIFGCLNFMFLTNSVGTFPSHMI